MSAKRNPETQNSFLVSIIVAWWVTVGQFGIIDKNFTLFLCKRAFTALQNYLKYGIKDWALLAKEFGIEIIEKYLKEKSII